MVDGPEVLTVTEVADILRISRGLAYEAIRKRELPAVRIGKRILVLRDALDDLFRTPMAAAGCAACGSTRHGPEAACPEAVNDSPNLAETDRRDEG